MSSHSRQPPVSVWQNYAMIACWVESPCCLIMGIGQNCPKIPPVAHYQGKRTCSSIDIIANKFLRLPAVNSKVVQSTGDLHHKIVILFFRISENVFDNATSFNSRNDMLNHNPDT